MIRTKTYVLLFKDNDIKKKRQKTLDPDMMIQFKESFHKNEEYSSHIWNCSLILSHFLWKNRSVLFHHHYDDNNYSHPPPSPGYITTTVTNVKYNLFNTKLDTGEIYPLNRKLTPELGLPQFSTVLELGCGVGLPSLLCRKLGSKRIVLTDREIVGPYIKESIRLNDENAQLPQLFSSEKTMTTTSSTSTNICATNTTQEKELCLDNNVSHHSQDDGSIIQFLPLNWFDSPEEIRSTLFSCPAFRPSCCTHNNCTENNAFFDQKKNDSYDSNSNYLDIDVVLGSDLLYDPKDFQPLLAFISYLLALCKPSTVFLMAYQERSSKRCIHSLLNKWGLECEIIPRSFYEWTMEQQEENHFHQDAQTNNNSFLPLVLREIINPTVGQEDEPQNTYNKLSFDNEDFVIGRSTFRYFNNNDNANFINDLTKIDEIWSVQLYKISLKTNNKKQKREMQ